MLNIATNATATTTTAGHFMARLWRPSTLFLACLGLAPAVLAQNPDATATPTANKRWTMSLTSQRTYKNPYYDLELKATFRKVTNGVAGPVLYTVAGYWDGNDDPQPNGTGDAQPILAAMKFRFAFPEPGATPQVWKWETSCQGASSGTSCVADPGLTKSGTVTVQTAAGETNVLYKRGMLRVANSNRFLSYGDGTAFFWLADTASAAPLESRTNASWKSYVDERSAVGLPGIAGGGRRFTVLELTPTWNHHDAAGNDVPVAHLGDADGFMPFEASSHFPTCQRWKSGFWRNLDEKVQWANNRGMVVFFTGLATVDYQLNGQAEISGHCTYDETLKFARNFAARNAGSFVIFSPGNDTRVNGAAEAERRLMEDVGPKVKAAAPLQLQTTHLAGSTAASLYFQYFSKPWMDFVMAQSGPDVNDTGEAQLQVVMDRAINLPKALYRRTGAPSGTPVKPVFNGEAIWEYLLANPTSALPERYTNHTAFRMRQAGWLSVLSGAFGYTMGTEGVWNWFDTATSSSGTRQRYYGDSLKSAAAAARAGADSMERLGNIQIQLPRDLVPLERVANQPAAAKYQMALAGDSGSMTTARVLVAYMPHNSEIRVDVTGLPCIGTASAWSKVWSSASQSRSLPAKTLCSDSGSCCLSGSTLVCSNPDGPATANVLEGTRDWVLVLRRSSQSCSSLAAGRSEAGGAKVFESLHAYVDSAVEGDPPHVWAYRVTGQAADIQKAVVVDVTAGFETGSMVDPLGGEPAGGGVAEPSVGLLADGSYLVAWSAEDGSGGHDIRARLLDTEGQPQGDIVSVAETESDETAPVVACGSTGACIMAWRSSDGVESRIWARTMDAGRLVGDVVELSTAPSAEAGKLLARATDGGDFLVAWESWEASEGSAVGKVYSRAVSEAGAVLGIDAATVAEVPGEKARLVELESGLGGCSVTWAVEAADGSSDLWVQGVSDDGDLVGNPLPADPES